MSYSDFFRDQLDEHVRTFESSLLEWMRDEKRTTALERIEHTLTNLSALDRREPYRKLWWLGSGMAEAMRYGAIDSAAQVKHLFADMLAELRDQRNAAGRVGGERRTAPPPALFDGIITALNAPTGTACGPIMRHIANEFSLPMPA